MIQERYLPSALISARAEETISSSISPNELILCQKFSFDRTRISDTVVVENMDDNFQLARSNI